MSFKTQTLSEKGPVRANNEDAIRFGYFSEQSALWMIVADGMGGHKAGEVASNMLTEYVESCMVEENTKSDTHWEVRLPQILREANQAIFDTAACNSEYEGMGTTGVLVVCTGEKLHVTWIGDSRAYLLRNKKLCQLTQDHTMIQYLLDKGSISEREAANSNTKHLLSKAIGVKSDVEPDYLCEKVGSGDVIMLTSDGIHDSLPDAILAGFLTRFRSESFDNNRGLQVVNLMAKEAINQGSRDNLTIGVFSMME